MQDAGTVLEVLRERGRKGQDRSDHRADARGAEPVRPGPPGADPEEERETAPALPAVLVRQARRRGSVAPAGGVFRAAVFWPVAWFPERARLSYRAAGDPADLDRDRVVYRGRHLRLLRQFQPRDPARDTGGED